MTEATRPTDEQYTLAAFALCADALSGCGLEINVGHPEDDHVMIAPTDDGGAWVRAWVWVSDDEIEDEARP